MAENRDDLSRKFDLNFRLFLELMAYKVQEILLVSSPYDAFIIEEDASLASRIINEYRGLNLSRPPRVTRTSSGHEALSILDRKAFDLVITTPHLDDFDAFSLGRAVKRKNPEVPVYLLAHSTRGLDSGAEKITLEGVDRMFLWLGNSDLLLAIIKNTEDFRNVDFDTRKAMVRVLILVEDSPLYYSSLLPFLYRVVVQQTQAVLERGLNEEHKLLTMRARPKILLARNYDEARVLIETYRPYILGIISDTRYPMGGAMKEDAGTVLLSQVRKEMPYLPMLLMSTEGENRGKAFGIPAVFADKNAPSFLGDIHDFFLTHLGFGDFVFRTPEGAEIGRASNLRELEETIASVPGESLVYHAERNHFSSWIMARSEITIASLIRDKAMSEFSGAEDIRNYITSEIHELRRWRQKGIVTGFHIREYDPDIIDFAKIGSGSMGGKARGLAFLSEMLHKSPDFRSGYPGVSIEIPKTLIVSIDGFESFVKHNRLEEYLAGGVPDEEIAKAFLAAEIPQWLAENLQGFLAKVDCPLAVRSSSLLQDAHFNPFVGLYETYMIPNNHRDPAVRMRHLEAAIKLVYASTCFAAPRTFAKSTKEQPGGDAMAVMIQQIAGERYGDYFYPSLSGVARSHNFYAVPPMKPEDGIAFLSLGFGKSGEEGGALRLCPRYPAVLPQFSTVDDIVKNAQRFFYALRINGCTETPDFRDYCNLEKRKVNDAKEEPPVQILSSTYRSDDNTIVDSGYAPGPKLVTFAQVLTHGLMPLPEILIEFLEKVRTGLGCPAEIEFAVVIHPDGRDTRFFPLQVRPMVSDEESLEITVVPEDIKGAFCYSTHALGNGRREDIWDIVYVKSRDFKIECTVQISDEISRINNSLAKDQRPCLLIGPGRWGSSDCWLGIPVRWQQISQAAVIVELRNRLIRADDSRGYHFLRHLTSQGVPYITVTEGTEEFVDWQWLDSLPAFQETSFVRHVRMAQALTIKIDGKKSHCVCIKT